MNGLDVSETLSSNHISIAGRAYMRLHGFTWASRIHMYLGGRLSQCIVCVRVQAASLVIFNFVCWKWPRVAYLVGCVTMSHTGLGDVASTMWWWDGHVHTTWLARDCGPPFVSILQGEKVEVQVPSHVGDWLYGQSNGRSIGWFPRNCITFLRPFQERPVSHQLGDVPAPPSLPRRDGDWSPAPPPPPAELWRDLEQHGAIKEVKSSGLGLTNVVVANKKKAKNKF